MEHTFITKNGKETKNITPLKAIRQKCLECSNWSSHEVKLCTCSDCVLFPFRFGKNKNIKRQLTNEQKQVFRDRMKKIWDKKRKDKNNDK